MNKQSAVIVESQLDQDTPQSPNLDTNPAAEYLGLSPSTLHKKRLDGTGPRFAKIGRRVIYRRADLDAWIEQHVVRSTSEVRSA